jgi:hypothetical protein
MAEVGEENVFVCEDEIKGNESCMFEDSGVNVGSLSGTQESEIIIEVIKTVKKVSHVNRVI